MFTEAIYRGVESYVNKTYPHDSQCIMEELRERKLADKVFSLDFLSNPLKFPTEIKPQYDAAVEKCVKVNDELWWRVNCVDKKKKSLKKISALKLCNCLFFI